MYEWIRQSAERLQPELTAVRRDLHRQPERAWEEVKTTRYIADYLACRDIAVTRRGFNGTESGLIADVSGRKDTGVIFAIRADIDALAQQEETGAAYASEIPGVSHACGHDAHTAMALGAASVLAENRDRFAGRVRFIFQPAEEGGTPSGARAMIDEGALEGVSAIFGMHIQATLPSRVFSYGFGPRMASSGKWRVLIKGKGGHGAFPELSRDPLVAACSFVMNLQTLVSRETRPLDAAVVSVGAFTPSSSVGNSIPDRVELQGTTRAYSKELGEKLHAGIRRIAKYTAATFRCEAEVSYAAGLPPLVNDAGITRLARDVAGELWGEEWLLEDEPQMGSEDFSHYLEEIPGSYCFLGCGGPGGPSPYAHHSPKFRIDESVLWMGAAQHAGVAAAYLARTCEKNGHLLSL